MKFTAGPNKYRRADGSFHVSPEQHWRFYDVGVAEMDQRLTRIDIGGNLVSHHVVDSMGNIIPPAPPALTLREWWALRPWKKRT